MHEVDEDIKSIQKLGGAWWEWNRSYGGITYRHMFDIHTNTYDFVASLKK